MNKVKKNLFLVVTILALTLSFPAYAFQQIEKEVFQTARYLRNGILGIFLAVSFTLWQSPAWGHEGDHPEGLPDLRATLVGPVETLSRGRIRFSIRITNSGSAFAQGTIRIKPFLLPVPGAEGTADLGDGIVLASEGYGIRLGVGNSVLERYTARLPKVKRSRYWVAAVIDSSDRMEEANELNNVTDALDAGILYQSATADDDEGLDLYSEIEGDVEVHSGRISHTLRTIVRGERIPERKSMRLWARFMLANLETGRVYSLAYEEGYVEKQFYALFWDRERDEQGNVIYVDYYYQDPSLPGAVEPGRYAFLTLMDSHDRFLEEDESNNLDLEPLLVFPLEMVNHPNEIWLAGRAGAAEPSVKTITFRNGYRESVRWAASVPPAASWFSVTPSSGELGPGEEIQVTLRAATASLGATTYRTELTMEVPSGRLQGARCQLPVTLFCHGPFPPRMELSTLHLETSTPQGVHPAPMEFQITNTGGASNYLQWRAWQDEHWITVAPTDGYVRAGNSATARVIIHPEELERGSHHGCIMIFNNVSNEFTMIEVHLEIL